VRPAWLLGGRRRVAAAAQRGCKALQAGLDSAERTQSSY